MGSLNFPVFLSVQKSLNGSDFLMLSIVLQYMRSRVKQSEIRDVSLAAQKWMRSFHVAVEESLYPCRTQKQ
jgi:hypothetical protein